MEHKLVKDSKVREAMDSKFRYVLVVAERAEQLMRGARAKLDLANAKPTRVAQEEIDREAVEWDYGPEPELTLPDFDTAPETDGDEDEAEAVPEVAAEEADDASGEDDEAVH